MKKEKRAKTELFVYALKRRENGAKLCLAQLSIGFCLTLSCCDPGHLTPEKTNERENLAVLTKVAPSMLDLRKRSKKPEEANADATAKFPKPKYLGIGKMTFFDDFSGSALDATKWSYCPELRRSEGTWSNQDAFLDGKGHLLLQVRKSADEYYSGAIRTAGKFEQKYGYFEASVTLPKEPGFWGAFWLMTNGAASQGNEGKDGTEIDILEAIGNNPNEIHHALHWDYGKNISSEGKTIGVPFSEDGFHQVALFWTPTEYIFYFDGKETWRTKAGGVSQVPQYIKLTTEIGAWAGDISASNLPAFFVVDYVRVVQFPDYDKLKID